MSDQLKTLVIAEKPSVAADICKVLNDTFKKEKTHHEGEKYIVSYAVGHLVTIADPKEMDAKYKSWSFKTLPIIPDDYILKPIETSSSKTQLTALGKLMRRKDVGLIINACDAGREGELIFRYILDYVGAKRKITKETKRLWLQSMTPDAIKKGFDNLKRDEEMLHLAQAAKSRSEADWLIGINGSRAMTAYNNKFGGFHLTPCGRVQTPTLSMIVKREHQRDSFVPEKYWTIEGFFSDGQVEYSGKWYNPEFSKSPDKPHHNAERLWEEEQAQKVKEACDGKPAIVEEKSKPSYQKCPALYDLTSLQREANSRFGFSAKGTLGIVQSLYEKYKMLTYPRTDSKCLPEDYLDQVKEVTEKLQSGEFEKYATKAIKNDYIKFDKRVFNNKKISDHHAIIPTPVKPRKLPEKEMKIYTMVVQRFLGIFYPPAKYQVTNRTTVVGDYYFKTEGKVLEIPGWKEVYEQESQGEKLLVPLKNKESVTTKELEIKEDLTKPPARYNESSLLSAMESAGKLVEDEELKEAMTERGLGTPATRAAIIEKLVSDKYMVREDRELVPTSKAFELLRLISAIKVEGLTSPELTAEWEHKLSQMEKGDISREDFMKEIANVTEEMVSVIKGYDEAEFKKPAPFSPLNGEVWFETLSRYTSEDGKKSIRKFLGGRHMSPEEIETLLIEGQLGPMEGFRSKRGNPFTAMLKTTDTGVTFVFGNAEDEEIEWDKATLIGKSFLDDSEVYMTDTHYVSKSIEDKEAKKAIKLNRVILGKEISQENMQKLIAGEKTDLIEGMRSSKTKRLFDAFLELDKDAKIKFSFPPRKSKKAAKEEGDAKAESSEKESK